MEKLPIIDVAPLVRGGANLTAVAAAIRDACQAEGFFYVVGHGVAAEKLERLEHLARRFFALDLETKMKIRMELGGRAWRGYFPVGAELTSGRADLKEGLYFGEELGDDDPRVRGGVPMHGRNLFPELPGFREAVLDYMEALRQLGHVLMRGIALSLDLEADYFAARYTRDPLILFRIFNYPPAAAQPEAEWGVGEHTDYGVLTMLAQDAGGGLEVRGRWGWIDAPPIAGSFVCNIGDMLDRMSGGRYRSTPHRVRNRGSRDRISFPFFFDPNFAAEVRPIPGPAAVDDRSERWDRASVHDFQGTYGEYLLGKVARVFPELEAAVRR